MLHITIKKYPLGNKGRDGIGKHISIFPGLEIRFYKYN